MRAYLRFWRVIRSVGPGGGSVRPRRSFFPRPRGGQQNKTAFDLVVLDHFQLNDEGPNIFAWH